MTGRWPLADGEDRGVWQQIFNFDQYGDLLALAPTSRPSRS